MARQPRIDIVGIPQHIIQRGVDRAACFVGNPDRQRYLSMLRSAAADEDCAIHAYVLMTNHVHLLATGHARGSISKMMQSLGRRYVLDFNKRYHRTGTLWEGRFKSCLVDTETYLLNCYRYIEMNPVRAALVARAADYRWSSLQANALGRYDPTLTPHNAYLAIHSDPDKRRKLYRDFISQSDERINETIRVHSNQGKALGSLGFQEQIAQLVGRSVSVRPQGRPFKLISPDPVN